MEKNISDKKLLELDLSSLRFIFNGAEPISAAVINDFVARFSACGFRDNIICPSYGLAEATVAVSSCAMGSVPVIENLDAHAFANGQIVKLDNSDTNLEQIKFVRVGRPFNNVSIRIANEQGEALPESQMGEIQVSGPSVTTGYYNLDQANQTLFDKKWLRTGDLGYIVDGDLVVTGRLKDIIFNCGKNYFAHDLEESVIKDGILNYGELVFVGLFNQNTQQEELIGFAKHKSDVKDFLPIRQQVIAKLSATYGLQLTHLIPVKAIPKTTSGKLQRFYLSQQYETGQYNDLIKEIEKSTCQNKVNNSDFSINEVSLETELRGIWSRILNVSEASIGIDDEFFMLGGNSIKAFQLHHAMELLIDNEIDLEILFVCKTIRQLIAYLKSNLQIVQPSKPEKSMSLSSNNEKLIAITGMSLKFPGANNQEDFWENLCSKKNAVTKVSEKRKKLSGYQQWDEWLGEVDGIDNFDNDFFGILPDEAAFMDPQQRIVLETSYNALEDAGVIPGLEQERHIGVYSGNSKNTYYELVLDYLKTHDLNEVPQNIMMGTLDNMIAALIARTYNFTGPAIAINTACSSFLVAMHHAVKALRQKSITGAVVVGSNLLATPTTHRLMRKAGILSSTGYAKVLDRDADGTVIGEGVVVFYLETLENAIKNNKHIYGIIRGSAINNDGESLGTMTPNPKTQHQVIEQAFKDANLSPNEISYIELHGTGTTIGDPIEVNALSKFFSKASNAKNTVGIGSVKSNTGHLLAAAGGAGIAKILLSLKHKKIPPSLHVKNINPTLKLEKSPFYLVNEVEDWSVNNGATRKAALSSFGLGGTNAHMILEEWVEDNSINHQQDVNLLTFSAKSFSALEKLIAKTKNMMQLSTDLYVGDLCFTRNRYRKHYPYRAALLIGNDKSIIDEYINNTYCNPNIRYNRVGIIVEDINNSAEIVEFLQNTINNTVTVIEESADMKLDQFNIILSLGVTQTSVLNTLFQHSKQMKKTTILMQKVNVADKALKQTLLAKLYINGADINWSNVQENQTNKLIHLPTYPFEEKQFWIAS